MSCVGRMGLRFPVNRKRGIAESWRCPPALGMHASCLLAHRLGGFVNVFADFRENLVSVFFLGKVLAQLLLGV